MAMEKKQAKEVSAQIRQLLQKAKDVSKTSPDYAITLLLGVIKREPAYEDARKLLREIERKKSDNIGFLGGMIAKFKITGKITKGMAIVHKKPLEAMGLAEEALALDLNSQAALNLLADAAMEAEAYFISIEALQMLQEQSPKDISILEKLAATWEKAGAGMEVLRIRQQIVSLKPGDMDAEQKLREAAALASLRDQNWDQAGKEKEGFRNLVKDSSQSNALEKQDKIVRSDDDIAEAIKEYENKIASGDETIDLRRKLAEYYQRGNRHQDAIKSFYWVAEKIGRLDPSIDKAIEKSELAILDEKAKADESCKDSVEKEKLALRLERAEKRVASYPNDNQLRYDLAEIYWETEEYDNAFEQFQLAQRNPQRRLASIVFLGRILHIKKQYDMATEQFKKALSEMLIMDRQKMDALYFYGILCEDAGKKDEARECYRQIYQSNVNYRDVKQRIENNH